MQVDARQASFVFPDQSLEGPIRLEFSSIGIVLDGTDSITTPRDQDGENKTAFVYILLRVLLVLLSARWLLLVAAGTEA